MKSKIPFLFKRKLSLILAKILLVETIIILGFVYLLVVCPTAIIARIAGKDFFKKKMASGSFWSARKLVSPTLEWAEKPY